MEADWIWNPWKVTMRAISIGRGRDPRSEFCSWNQNDPAARTRLRYASLTMKWSIFRDEASPSGWALTGPSSEVVHLSGGNKCVCLCIFLCSFPCKKKKKSDSGVFVPRTNQRDNRQGTLSPRVHLKKGWMRRRIRVADLMVPQIQWPISSVVSHPSITFQSNPSLGEKQYKQSGNN